MKIHEILVERVSQSLSDQVKWSNSVKEMYHRSGNKHPIKFIKTKNGNITYAVDNSGLGVIHAYGEWNEKDEEGIVYDIRRRLNKNTDF